jgi:xylan 1,4-beta-xylosidase
MTRGGLILGLAGAVVAGSAVSAEQHTTINPVDIDYRYNFEELNEGISYRTGADPAIVNHKGVYYLFETLADGYWRSTDLMHWQFVTPSRWPMQSIVAPAVWSDGTRIIVQPSMMEPGTILSSTDPDSGKLDYWVRRMPPLPGSVDKKPEAMKPGEVPPGPWDPALFKDDDGQWYLYWDSSNVFPIYGQKIAFEDGKLIYQTHADPLFKLHPDRHGWERFGQDHSGLLANGQPTDPYVEGAWMTKVGGRYYFQ